MRGLALLAIALSAAILWAIAWIVAGQQARIDSYSSNCVAAGGHVYNPGGVRFCVSADGRWVEVYP